MNGEDLLKPARFINWQSFSIGPSLRFPSGLRPDAEYRTGQYFATYRTVEKNGGLVFEKMEAPIYNIGGMTLEFHAYSQFLPHLLGVLEGDYGNFVWQHPKPGDRPGVVVCEIDIRDMQKRGRPQAWELTRRSPTP